MLLRTRIRKANTACRRWWEAAVTLPAPTLVQLKDIAGATRDFSLVLAIVFYFSGWVFLNSMLQSFGLRLADYEQPLYYMLLYAGIPVLEGVCHPLKYASWWIQLFALLALGFLWVQFARRGRFISFLFIPIYCLFLILVALRQADTVGKGQAEYITSGRGNKVVLKFKEDYLQNALKENKDDKEPYLADLIEGNKEHKLRVVWRTKDALYVIRIVDGAKNFEMHEIKNEYLIGTTVIVSPESSN